MLFFGQLLTASDEVNEHRSDLIFGLLVHRASLLFGRFFEALDDPSSELAYTFRSDL